MAKKSKIKIRKIFFSELYTSKNQQKFTDFEGVVWFLIRQIDKKLFQKMLFLPILPRGSILPNQQKLYWSNFLIGLTIYTTQEQVKH